MGVSLLDCANTLRERKIDLSTLYGVSEDDLVPSGVAKLPRLQGMGFLLPCLRPVGGATSPWQTPRSPAGVSLHLTLRRSSPDYLDARHYIR